MALYCPNGHGIGEDKAKFCAKCGAKLYESVTKFQHLLYVKGLEPCPECGYQLSHGHQAHCPGCSKSLNWTCR